MNENHRQILSLAAAFAAIIFLFILEPILKKPQEQPGEEALNQLFSGETVKMIDAVSCLGTEPNDKIESWVKKNTTIQPEQKEAALQQLIQCYEQAVVKLDIPKNIGL